MSPGGQDIHAEEGGDPRHTRTHYTPHPPPPTLLRAYGTAPPHATHTTFAPPCPCAYHATHCTPPHSHTAPHAFTAPFRWELSCLQFPGGASGPQHALNVRCILHDELWLLCASPRRTGSPLDSKHHSTIPSARLDERFEQQYLFPTILDGTSRAYSNHCHHYTGHHCCLKAERQNTCAYFHRTEG